MVEESTLIVVKIKKINNTVMRNGERIARDALPGAHEQNNQHYSLWNSEVQFCSHEGAALMLTPFLHFDSYFCKFHCINHWFSNRSLKAYLLSSIWII